MDAATIIQTISIIASAIKQAVDLGPTVIKVANDAKPFAEAIVRTILGRDPTPEEVTALEAELADLSAQLQEPLPPEQPDDV